MDLKYFEPNRSNTNILLHKPGTYAILLFLESKKEIQIGRMGKFCFKKGFYIYTGSAMGMGGIKSRLNRHIKKEKSRHWHVDYLRDHSEIAGILYCYGNEKIECNLASAFNLPNGFSCPVKGFGSSDCKCISHLAYSKNKANFSRLIIKLEVELNKI